MAAASVIAREIFLRDVAKMSEEIFGQEPPAEGEEKRTVPIGSSDPKVRALAEEMVRKEGPVWLMNHAKAHFQTTDKVAAVGMKVGMGGNSAGIACPGVVGSAASSAAYATIRSFT